MHAKHSEGGLSKRRSFILLYPSAVLDDELLYSLRSSYDPYLRNVLLTSLVGRNLGRTPVQCITRSSNERCRYFHREVSTALIIEQLPPGKDGTPKTSPLSI